MTSQDHPTPARRRRPALAWAAAAGVVAAATVVALLATDRQRPGSNKAAPARADRPVPERPASDRAATVAVEPLAGAADELLAGGRAWLRARQAADGSFGNLGTTLLAVDALTAGDPAAWEAEPVRRAVRFVLRYRQPTGGVLDPESGFGVHTTALGLRLLAGRPGVDPAVADGCRAFLLACQVEEPGPHDGAFATFRPAPGTTGNLIATYYAVDALAQTGTPADHPALRRSLAFLQRCQNLASHNDQPWAGTDGGAVYQPVPGPGTPYDAAAGRYVTASYGSMTHALVHAYARLGLPPDDPRLAAAVGWALRNYRFDVNPGLPDATGRESRYFYLHAAARTFDLLGRPTLALPEGRTADWRVDLLDALRAGAKPAPLAGGTAGAYWVGLPGMLMESDPRVATSYALVALAHVRASLAAAPPTTRAAVPAATRPASDAGSP